MSDQLPPDRVAELMEQGVAQVIDIREPHEHEAGHVAGDRHIELPDLTEQSSTLDRKRPVVVYSDSQYSIGLLTQNWKAKANAELVAKLRGLTRQFADLRFVKVAAHSGIPLNERVDELARNAITRSR